MDKKTEARHLKIEKRFVDDLKEIIAYYELKITEDPSPILMHILAHRLLVYQLYHIGKPDFAVVYQWIEKAYTANKHNINATNVYIDCVLAQTKALEKIYLDLDLHWKTFSECTTKGGNTIFIPDWFTKRGTK